MATPTKIEFAVRMVCQSCENSVRKSLENVEGVKDVHVSFANEQVIVETTLPSDKVQKILESTGKVVRLVGVGSGNKEVAHLGAAVAIMDIGNSMVKGVVRFIQTNERTCIIDGTIDGLPPGRHPICVHEYGDISDECKSCGPVLGMLGVAEKAKGMIAQLEVGHVGRTEFRVENNKFNVSEIIGRSLVIHKENLDNNTQNRLLCGIIARSAGLFQNTKKYCACDGVSIWDEANKPTNSTKSS